MTAVERLQAAIEKLETLRSEERIEVTFKGVPIDSPLVPVLMRAQMKVDLWDSTIDAQLAILRHIATHYSGDVGIGTNRHVVALADAILGADQ